MTPTARRAPAVAAVLLAALVTGPSASVEPPSAVVRGAHSGTPAATVRPARWLHVRVWETGSVAPTVSVRVPTALVSVTVGLLSWIGVLDHALEQARTHAGTGGCSRARVNLSGREVVRLWSSLVSGGATPLVAVRSADGSQVDVRLE